MIVFNCVLKEIFTPFHNFDRQFHGFSVMFTQRYLAYFEALATYKAFSSISEIQSRMFQNIETTTHTLKTITLDLLIAENSAKSFTSADNIIISVTMCCVQWCTVVTVIIIIHELSGIRSAHFIPPQAFIRNRRVFGDCPLSRFYNHIYPADPIKNKMGGENCCSCGFFGAAVAGSALFLLW